MGASTGGSQLPHRDDATVYDELKRLLLGREREELHELKQRIDDRGLRAEDVAEILPLALHASARRGDALARALQEPVKGCLHAAIRDDTRTFADALFPVMGPAIRRSISETLRDWVQTINRIVDQSFSLRGLGWRFESLRSGVPFHEVVLRHTLVYRVEQLFLIHLPDGLLLHHVARADVAARDPDSVSAMLTAIGDFVRDSFGGDSIDETIDSVEIGEQTVWVVRGPEAVIAAVIRGIPPTALRGRLATLLEEIHLDYRNALTAFDGNREPFEEVDAALAQMLVAVEQPLSGRRAPSLLLGLVPLALLVGLGYWGYQRHVETERFERLIAGLDALPGWIVLTAEATATGYRIDALADPLSPAAAPLIEASGYAAQQIELAVEPVLALEPALNLERVTNALEPPATVTLELDGTTLRARGVAERGWRERARLVATALPGVTRLDDSGLEDPDQLLLQRVRALLDPPDTVAIGVDDGVLRIAGTAPLNWIDALDDRLTGIVEPARIERTGLAAVEIAQLEAAIGQLHAVRVEFDPRSSEPAGDETAIANAARLVATIQRLSHLLDRSPRFEVRGHTDGTGTAAYNFRLARARAESLREALRRHGIDPGPASITLDHATLRQDGRYADIRVLEAGGR